MGTNTATIETLTAEVRVLMVGSRQVTLSVYRQLDRHPSSQVQPFGRVSDKQDESRYACRNVFVVGCEITTGALVRSEHFARTGSPERYQEVVNRRADSLYDGRRSYGNDPRKSVEPFAVERRVEDRREHPQRRVKAGSGVWVWSETVDEFRDRLSAWEESGVKYDEWIELPLIVLAGLR